MGKLKQGLVDAGVPEAFGSVAFAIGERAGPYVLKHWSKDQGNVAKSSGEAELYAANYGADHGLGLQSLLKDIGIYILKWRY